MVFILILIPIVGSIAISCARTEYGMRLIGIWTTLVTFIVSVVLWLLFDHLNTKSELQVQSRDLETLFESNIIHIKYLNIKYLSWFGEMNIPICLNVTSKNLLFVILCITLFTLALMSLNRIQSEMFFIWLLFAESFLITGVCFLEINAYLHFLYGFDESVWDLFRSTHSFLSSRLTVLVLATILKDPKMMFYVKSNYILLAPFVEIGNYFRSLLSVWSDYTESVLVITLFHIMYIDLFGGNLVLFIILFVSWFSAVLSLSILSFKTIVFLSAQSALAVSGPLISLTASMLTLPSDYFLAWYFRCSFYYNKHFWFYSVAGLILFYFLRYRVPLWLEWKRVLDIKYGSIIVPCIFFLAIQLQALFICLTYLAIIYYDPFLYFYCWSLYCGFLVFCCWYWYYFVSYIFWDPLTIAVTTCGLIASTIAVISFSF